MWTKADPQIALYEKSLDFSHLRHEVLSNNIANADTPGYKRQDVTFESILGREVLSLQETRSAHIPGRENYREAPEVITEEGTRTRVDGSNVDVEVEMAKMAGNALYYDTISQLTGSRFRMIGKIIEQGGRS